MVNSPKDTAEPGYEFILLALWPSTKSDMLLMRRAKEFSLSLAWEGGFGDSNHALLLLHALLSLHLSSSSRYIPGL